MSTAPQASKATPTGAQAAAQRVVLLEGHHGREREHPAQVAESDREHQQHQRPRGRRDDLPRPLARPFLTVEEVADRYRTSVKSFHDRTRTDRIPFVKRQGFRRLLFPLADLEAWDEGAELVAVNLPDGRAIRAQTVLNGEEGA
jgi:hypothetical protein